MMSCTKATQLISEGQDRTLTRAERVRLSVHTMMCRSCNRFGKQMILLRNIARKFAHTGMPPDQGDDEDTRPS